MPAYRFRSEKYISRGFKDFSISFSNNPTTKDFGMVKNENAIKQSVRNLISTIFGERPFQPDIGSRVKGLLFENFDPFSVDAIRSEIVNVLERLEPRIEVEGVDVIDESELNSLEVSLTYKIVGEEQVQTVEFLLEKT